MTDPGFIVAGYGLTAAVVAAYALSLRSRIKRVDLAPAKRRRES
jgi:hypothetical protein